MSSMYAIHSFLVEIYTRNGELRKGLPYIYRQLIGKYMDEANYDKAEKLLNAFLTQTDWLKEKEACYWDQVLRMKTYNDRTKTDEKFWLKNLLHL